MKYMLIMRSTADSNAAFEESGLSFDDVIESMSRFNEEMIQAGVLLAMEGLDDAANGVVVDYSTTPPVVTDGP